MNPIFGVVVPVFNEEKYIVTLIESLTTQTGFSSLKCIVFVDGGSTDNSALIISEYANKYSNFFLLPNPKKKTPYAFNIGIKKCLELECKVISLFSAHSWLKADFFTELEKVYKSSDFDILGSVHRFEMPGDFIGKLIVCFSENRLGRGLRKYSDLKSISQTSLAFCPSIKDSVFEKIGYFNEQLDRNQDNDFTSRAFAQNLKIYTDPGLIYFYIPRTNIGKLMKQMYNNGIWIGKNPKAHQIKYFIPLFFILAIIITTFFLIATRLYILFIPLAFLYYLTLLVASLSEWKYLRLGILLFPFMLFSIHIMYGIGIMRGLIRRNI